MSPYPSTLSEFRRWSLSADFPERGRIDFIAGNIEADLSPKDFFTYGTLKTALLAAFARRVERLGLGHVVTRWARFVSPQAQLSAEPDMMILTYDALASGRVRLIETAGGAPGRFVEIEGSVELIVEIVNDASGRSDLQRLPRAYYDAGVLEYWLVNARGEELVFVIHRRGPAAYEPSAIDATGHQRSHVLQAACRLDRRRDDRGYWVFELSVRPD